MEKHGKEEGVRLVGRYFNFTNTWMAFHLLVKCLLANCYWDTHFHDLSYYSQRFSLLGMRDGTGTQKLKVMAEVGGG
jgi:hypothetical protein